MSRWTQFTLAIADAAINLGQAVRARYAEAPNPPITRGLQWQTALMAFAYRFDSEGPSQRRMFLNGVCSRPTWQIYTNLLMEAGAIVKVPRSGTYWRAGYSRAQLRADIKMGRLRLPYPTHMDPPPLMYKGRCTVYTTQSHRAERAQ